MTCPAPRPLIELSENHRQTISITLQLLDKALCEWDDWARGCVQTRVMYREKDTFSTEQRNELQTKVARIRRIISGLHDDLQLEAKVVLTSQPIVGQAAVLWEMLAELNSRSLEGYGRVPEELANYLDPIGEKLAAEMNEISFLFSRPRAAAGDE